MSCIGNPNLLLGFIHRFNKLLLPLLDPSLNNPTFEVVMLNCGKWLGFSVPCGVFLAQVHASRIRGDWGVWVHVWWGCTRGCCWLCSYVIKNFEGRVWRVGSLHCGLQNIYPLAVVLPNSFFHLVVCWQKSSCWYRFLSSPFLGIVSPIIYT